MASLPREIFKAYDIRGIVGKTLTAAIVRSVGHAVGSLAREAGRDTFAIGRDGRLSGPELAAALSEGLRAAGANVIDLGMVATPMTYFAAEHLRTGCSVMVTGSHNPPDYNGLKMVVAGATLSGDAIQDLRSRIEGGRLASGAGTYSTHDIAPAYLDRIARDVKLARPMKIAVDCGNGVAGAFAPALYRNMGCDVVELFCDVDGNFPITIPTRRSPPISPTSRAGWNKAIASLASPSTATAIGWAWSPAMGGPSIPIDSSCCLRRTYLRAYRAPPSSTT